MRKKTGVSSVLSKLDHVKAFDHVKLEILRFPHDLNGIQRELEEGTPFFRGSKRD